MSAHQPVATLFGRVEKLGISVLNLVNRLTDEMDNLTHADTKLKELMEVPDESKDVTAGTSDRLSLEEAADDAR